MFTRLVKAQLAVFSVLAVTAGVVVGQDYLRWGEDQFTVTADFADATGLHADAPVTYLGVQVGRVRSLELREDGVRAVLSIDAGAKIPSGAHAAIRGLSAVGENYLDLSPDGPGEEDLVEGSRIPMDNTSALASSAELLSSLDRLSASVPADRLRTVLTEVNAAFQDSGEDLGRLLDSSTLLLHQAAADIGPTRGLINGLGPFLVSQRGLDGRLRSFTRDLASFTDQLRLSDADLRTLIDSGPPLAAEFGRIEDQLGPTLPVLLANLISSGQVVRTYLPGVEQVLVLYPALSAAVQSVLLPHRDIGAIGNVLRLNVNDPPPCTTGYLPNPQRRDPADTSRVAAPTDLYCKAAPGDQRVVRGARNTPCLNAPGRRAASPADCLAGYDSTNGRFLSPDGSAHRFGEHQGEELGWQSLMVK
ncbi:MCE family protein [Kutzneria albida]|uniref:Mce/MlaD domain-containing protein n=1 Tax=Kutzneria albida DSM 43870 TaxID=1449976 RepID=W5WJM4_9PSEU|nr:MlaD family protein [Kutzneria albida]AHI01068.1 hypothetical protein KALB_7710 [Kutzneria albida DSM 43870]